MMAFLQQMRSPRLTFVQTVLSLFLGALTILSSYWCEGKQKMPKPLCTAFRNSNCIPVPGVSHAANMDFSWETGDDRFVFPNFHIGLFIMCEEDIHTDTWEEKCRGFHTLTPGSEKVMMWLSLSLELMYIGLLLISCMLLSVQLCIRACFPSTQRWGQLLNAFAAVFTVLGGLLGMVGHMMFMQVFQTTVSMGPEDFKPHSYAYSWAFYVAWIAFTVCMLAGVSTLNNYTKRVLMVGPRSHYDLNPCGMNFMGLPPPAPYYTPPTPAGPSACPSACPPSPTHISHLSPYYEPPPPALPAASPRLTHSHSNIVRLPKSDSFPVHPCRPAPASPYRHLSLQSLSPNASLYVHIPLPGHQDHMSPHYYPEEDYNPL